MHLFFQILLPAPYIFLTNPRQRTFIKLALLYGGKKRYREGRIKFEGFNFTIPDYKSFLWQYKEIFVDKNYNFVSASADPIIYDCGANVGTSCAYFKRIYPDANIKAFEANPKIAEYLRMNIKKNYLDKVDVIDKAIWINNDGVDLNFEDADASSVYTDGKKQMVNSIRLKDLLDSENKVDMLKMDIEGAENEVLLDCDASLKVVRNIFIEYHSFANSSQNLSDLLNVLERNNFRYFIRNDSSRSMPLINKTNKSNPDVDLQLNIFAYRD